MPLFKKSSQRRAERVVRKTLADGTVKEYRYPPASAKKKRSRFEDDTLGALILSHKISPEWRDLADVTKTYKMVYLRSLERIGHVAVKKLTRRQIHEIRDAIALKRGNGAANAFVQTTSTLLSWAVDRGWIPYSPTNGIKALPGGHLRAWTAQEADLAESKLSEPLRRVIVLARHTAQRRGDLCAMTWSAYDGQTIRLRQLKGGDKAPLLVVPVPPVLKRELDQWRSEATSTQILTAPNGQPWHPNYLSHAMPIALQAAGLDKGLNVHGLRKLAAASLADAGCSTHEIMAITGHKTLSMVQLYTASADQERLAHAAIDRLHGAKIQPLKPRSKSLK